LSCQGFIFPNSSALTLAEFGHNAGSASALMGAIQMSIGAGASALVSLLQNNTALPMAGVMACSPLGALIMFSLGRKIILKRASKEAVECEEVEMISTL
jgi:DHA1 family bicyclomycin/chloramphenicol resistance-like MFS transporter